MAPWRYIRRRDAGKGLSTLKIRIVLTRVVSVVTKGQAFSNYEKEEVVSKYWKSLHGRARVIATIVDRISVLPGQTVGCRAAYEYLR